MTTLFLMLALGASGPPAPPNFHEKTATPKAQEQKESWGQPMVRFTPHVLVPVEGFVITNISVVGDQVTLEWQGGQGPFLVESEPSLNGPWMTMDLRPTMARSVTFPATWGTFFRVQGNVTLPISITSTNPQTITWESPEVSMSDTLSSFIMQRMDLPVGQTPPILSVGDPNYDQNWVDCPTATGFSVCPVPTDPNKGTAASPYTVSDATLPDLNMALFYRPKEITANGVRVPYNYVSTSRPGDTTPPIVGLTSPTYGSTVTHTITLTASAFDNVGVRRIDFYRDNAVLLGTASSTPFQIMFDTTTVDDGRHAFYCIAYDLAGNSSVSNTNLVMILNGGVGGQVLALSSFGGSTSSDIAQVNGLAVDGSDNVIVVGQFYGTVNFGNGHSLTAAGLGTSDIFVAKYDANFTCQWAKGFGGTANDSATGVAVDHGGNIIVIGYFVSTIDFGNGTAVLTSAGSSDIFVAKFTTSGLCKWSKGLGGTGVDEGLAIAVDAGNNIFVTGFFGEFGSGVDFGNGVINSAGSADIFLAKYSPTGSHVWSKGIGGTGTDMGQAICVDVSGNVVIAGRFQNTVNFGGGDVTSAGDDDAFVAKYSGVDGTHIWSKPFGDAQSQRAYGVASDSAGNVIITGDFYGAINLGGGTLTAAQGGSIFLAKYSSSGAHLWSHSFGTAQVTSIHAAAVMVGKNDQVVFTGFVEASEDFGCFTLSGSGKDTFIINYSPAGACLWSKRGSPNGDIGSTIAHDSNGNVLVSGWFDSQLSFGGSTEQSPGGLSGYLLKLSEP